MTAIDSFFKEVRALVEENKKTSEKDSGDSDVADD